jgi:hypothetical protein
MDRGCPQPQRSEMCIGGVKIHDSNYIAAAAAEDSRGPSETS